MMSIAAPPVPNGPAAASVAPPPEREIASFGRRLLAFILDSLIVGVAAFVFAIPFFNPLSKLGPYGRLVGIVLALPYYAILNSKIGNGQTIGKRILDTQVVDAKGQTISFGRSLVRYLLLAVPYFLSDASISKARLSLLGSVSLQALGVVSGATLYLLIFNRRTRQGIHDLAVDTFVVQADVLSPPKKRSIWMPHWLIYASLVIIAYTGGPFAEERLMKWAPIPQMLEDVRLMEQLDGVQSAQAMDQKSVTTWGQAYPKRSLVITIHWVGESADRTAFADQAAKTILAHDLTARRYDTLKVVVVRSYDIGIAKSSRTYFFEHSPAEWSSHWSGTPIPG
jgi:uncharacterized RDD family membrane protein YckC